MVGLFSTFEFVSFLSILVFFSLFQISISSSAFKGRKLKIKIIKPIYLFKLLISFVISILKSCFGLGNLIFLSKILQRSQQRESISVLSSF